MSPFVCPSGYDCQVSFSVYQSSGPTPLFALLATVAVIAIAVVIGIVVYGRR